MPYLTEEEAVQKRCCGPDGCGIVIMSSMTNGRFCIASNCMAWRWATYFKNTKTGAAPMKPGAYEIGTASECGYCGLAVVPTVNDAFD